MKLKVRKKSSNIEIDKNMLPVVRVASMNVIMTTSVGVLLLFF